jgi:hypothetical protein
MSIDISGAEAFLANANRYPDLRAYIAKFPEENRAEWIRCLRVFIGDLPRETFEKPPYMDGYIAAGMYGDLLKLNKFRLDNGLPIFAPRHYLTSPRVPL